MTDVLIYPDELAVEVDPAFEEPVDLPMGGIAFTLDESRLLKLGTAVVDDWQRDKSDRSEWEEGAKKALDRAAQEKMEAKDYPWKNCYTLDTDVMTVDGWRPVASLRRGDIVLTRDPEGRSYYGPVTETFYGQTEELVHFKGKSIDLLVTPNHKMLVENKKGVTRFVEASELADPQQTYQFQYIPLTSQWSGEDVSTIHGVPAKAYVRLLGWYLSEGSANRGQSLGSLSISQSLVANPEKYAVLVSDIEDAGISSKQYDRQITLHARSMPQAMKDEFRATGTVAEKRVPRHIMSLPPYLLAELLDTLVMGDGCTARNGHRAYYTTSPQLADDVQEICQKIGLRGTVKEVPASEGGTINGRQISGARTAYVVRINAKPRIKLATLHRRRIQQRAEIACVETPNHTLYVRRNGIAVWCGNSANVSYPMLTVAALQFQARAYPAIVKNDEAVAVKVFGTPPQVDPLMQALASQEPGTNQQLTPEQTALLADAKSYMASYQDAVNKRAFKQRRAKRVGDYLNYQLFYGMPDWEADTDSLLLQLPIVGAAFRKSFVDPDTGRIRSCYVPAMNLIVPQSATSLETTPRVTEEMHNVYPYQIKSRQASAIYMDWPIMDVGDEDQEPRLLLEQYRLEDLDEDGIDEPYIVTVDVESAKVLRLEQGWTEEKLSGDVLTGFVRFMPYTLYGFIPDPKGRFYPIGFGHLLDPISDIVNTTINQLIDAGHAQIAGGGFIASGLRLQGAGKTNTLRWQPGEYKSVQATGQQLRDAIYERTFPNPSPVAFSMLEMMLGAAKDITATSDVITGNAPATAPVGTTLALIEQGLQVYTAIYKRVYRSAKTEFKMLYEMTGAYGDAAEYLEVVDDPEANLEADFSPDGKDIVPVSDPTASTKMQQAAKAQFLAGERGKGLNDRAITMRMFQALDIDNPEELIGDFGKPPAGAEEAQQFAKAAAEAEVSVKKSTAIKNVAAAQKSLQEAQAQALENGITQAEIAAIFGGVPGMAGPSDNGMGLVPDASGFGGPQGQMA